MKQRGLIEDSSGDLSSKRFLSFICLAIGAGLAIGGLIIGRDVSSSVYTFVGACVALQGVSVFAEKGS